MTDIKILSCNSADFEWWAWWCVEGYNLEQEQKGG